LRWAKSRKSPDQIAKINCQPQDGQVDFGSHVFTTNRTSSERKEIFSIFNRSGASRIVFIHRYFLTLVSSINPITNLPTEPIAGDPAVRLPGKAPGNYVQNRAPAAKPIAPETSKVDLEVLPASESADVAELGFGKKN
jgi:hypothetical protein